MFFYHMPSAFHLNLCIGAGYHMVFDVCVIVCNVYVYSMYVCTCYTVHWYKHRIFPIFVRARVHMCTFQHWIIQTQNWIEFCKSEAEVTRNSLKTSKLFIACGKGIMWRHLTFLIIIYATCNRGIHFVSKVNYLRVHTHLRKRLHTPNPEIL